MHEMKSKNANVRQCPNLTVGTTCWSSSAAQQRGPTISALGRKSKLRHYRQAHLGIAGWTELFGLPRADCAGSVLDREMPEAVSVQKQATLTRALLRPLRRSHSKASETGLQRWKDADRSPPFPGQLKTYVPACHLRSSASICGLT